MAGHMGNLSIKHLLERTARYVDWRHIADAAELFAPSVVPVPDEYVQLPDGLSRLTRSPPPTDLSKWAADVVRIRTEVLNIPKPPLDAPAVQEMWDTWGKRLAAYLQAGTYRPAPVEYRELLLAVEDRWPASLFRHNLDDLSIADWSELCARSLAGQPGESRAAPPWAFVAALRVLGFRLPTLRRAIEEVNAGKVGRRAGNGPATMELMEQFAHGASEEPSLPMLVLMRQSNSLGRITKFRPPAPILAFPPSDQKLYTPLVNWLIRNDSPPILTPEREDDDRTQAI
jgi:hypothetical protein